jgi:iron complex outermembrane recepter protein
MNMKMKQLSLAVVQAIAFGVGAGIATSAVAQTPAPATPPAVASEKIEKIEVTGSRIPAPNLEGASPVTVVDAATIKTDGLRSVENLLNNLPQVFADQGASVSNGSSGTATVNLRNLGANRTLVLVNGRRLPAGSPGTIAADLNQVPAGLVKRVEILTGGASAIYGSDAIAGVVNFIMNDKFEGVQLQVNQSFYNHKQQNAAGVADLVSARGTTNPANFQVPGNKSADGEIFDANMILGSNFANGKGNATVFFAYKKEQALLQRDRDFSACGVTSNGVANESDVDGFTCGGSSTSATGRIVNLTNNRSFTPANSAGEARRYNSATDAYNFNPTNFYQRPSERYSFSSFANYDVTDFAKVYAEFSFHNDSTVAQIAPGGIFFTDDIYKISAANPLLTPSWRTALGLVNPTDTTDVWIGRRNVEGGGRTSSFTNTSFRTLVGVKGEIGNWNYDAFLQTSKVNGTAVQDNYFSKVRIALALDAVVDPATGRTVCRSALPGGSSPKCVPYNVWSLGAVTPEQLAYLQTPGNATGATQQAIQGANVATDLGNYGVRLPSAKNGVGISFGVERRTEKLDNNTDKPTQDGDLSGAGGPNGGIRGAKFTVQEIFAEVRAPLIEGKAFADLLSVNASYRNSDYSKPSAKTNTYGLGIEWAPVKAARFRGTYQQAVRAPNLIELYTVAGIGLYDGADPCEGTNPVAANPVATAANCARTGLSAAQYGNVSPNLTSQYTGLFGGNANLVPETAKSTTLGLVMTPMKNLSMTLDYFNIKVDKTISAVPPTTTLTNCLATGLAVYCGAIQRDQFGTLYSPQSFIVANNVNIGSTKTSGLDVGFNYIQKIGAYGSLTGNFLGTYLKSYDSEPVKGAGSYSCVGLYGLTCGTPLPEWRHKARVSWATPWDVDFSMTWRFFGQVSIDTSSENALLKAPTNNVDRTLGSRNYLDLALAWQATKALSLSGGINNLLDRDPPISGNTGTGFGNGNTFPQVYDALGRRVFLNATYKF